MDEIGYRSVIIGFPLFALGGILFASIWAQMAWSRYWGWDPKSLGAYNILILCDILTFEIR